MTQIDTRQRIIDAAEKLFAEKGFNNTTMRAITGLAEVNLAAVNYHLALKNPCCRRCLNAISFRSTKRDGSGWKQYEQKPGLIKVN